MMNLKHLLLALFVCSLTFTACEKDEFTENIEGTWTFSAVTVNGQPGTGVGWIVFNEDLTGEVSLNFSGDGVQFVKIGGFEYSATKGNLVFQGSGTPITWERIRNEMNLQEFSFEEEIQGNTFDVVLTLTR